MALVKMLDKYDLQNEFKEFDRDYYSLDGYQAIIDLFEEVGGNVDLDVIAICCDFSEYDPADIISDYSNIEDIANCVDEVNNIDTDALLGALNYYTYAVMLDNGNILFQSF